jgi:hypothetical protein
MRTILVRNVNQYGALALAVLLTAGVCEGLRQAGIADRGVGALLWLPVLLGAKAFGRGPGIAAALSAATTYFYVFASPGWTWDTVAILTSMMVVAAYCAGAELRARALVVLFWKDENTGDYWRDVGVGETRCGVFLKGLRNDRQAQVLGLMVRDMIALRHYGGAEAGFFHRISRELISSPSIRVVAAHDDAKHLDLEAGVVEVQNHVVGGAVGEQQPRLHVLP